MIEELKRLWIDRERLGLTLFEKKLIQGIIAQLEGNGRGTISAKQHSMIENVLAQHRGSLMETKTLTQKEEEQSYKSKLIAIIRDKAHWGAVIPRFGEKFDTMLNQLEFRQLRELEELNREFIYPPDWDSVPFRKKLTAKESRLWAADVILGDRVAFEYDWAQGEWRRRKFSKYAREQAKKLREYGGEDARHVLL